MGKEYVADLVARDRTAAGTRSAGRNFEQLARKTDAASKKQSRAAAAWSKHADSIDRKANIVGAAMLGVGLKSIQMAAEAEQSVGGVESIFGKYAKSVVKRSKQASDAVGLSADQYRKSATLIGAQLRNQGVAQDKLGGSTDKLIRLASDFAATYGGSVPQAVEAVNAALKGEFERLESYGISIKQATVNTEKYRLAKVKSAAEFNKLSEAQQKAATRQAILNLMYEQGAPAIGQFGREADTTSGKVERLKARGQDLAVMLGNELLPAADAAITKTSSLAHWVSENDRHAKALAISMGGAVLAVKAAKFGPQAAGVVALATAMQALAIEVPAVGRAFRDISSDVSNDSFTEEITQWKATILNAVAAVLEAWAKINPRMQEPARAVREMATQASADLERLKTKHRDLQTQLAGDDLKAKFTVEKADAERNLASIKQQLQDPNLTKDRKAQLKADKRDAERKIADLKRKLAGLGDTRTVAKLEADKRDAEAKVRIIKAKLRDPDLTKTRRAKLEAKKDQAEAAVARVKALLASINDKTVWIRINRSVKSYYGKSGVPTNPKGDAVGDTWSAAAGGSRSRSHGPAPITVEAPIVDVRAFIDSTELRAIIRSTIVDENRRQAYRARVGKRF